MDSDINDIPSLLMWVQQLLKCRRSWQCCSWEWFAVSEKHFCVFSCWTFHHTNKTADVVRVPFAAGSGGASESAAENPVHGSKTQLMSWKSLKLQNSSVRTEYMSLGGWRLTEVKHVKRFQVLNQSLSDLFSTDTSIWWFKSNLSAGRFLIDFFFFFFSTGWLETFKCNKHTKKQELWTGQTHFPTTVTLVLSQGQHTAQDVFTECAG